MSCNVIATNCGMTPLHVAILKGHTDIVKTLIAANANVDAAENTHGWTPIYIASARGNIEMVKVLIDAGADVNIPIRAGLRPIDVAIIKERIDIIIALIEADADINQLYCNYSKVPRKEEEKNIHLLAEVCSRE